MRTCHVSCIFLLFHCLFFSTGIEAQVQKIYLNPKMAASGKQSQFIDYIHFIPLEAKEDIDPGQFNYVTVTKSYLLIIDYPGRTIYVYTRSGAFVQKISYKSLEEGLNPRYDEPNNQLVFFGDNKNYALTSRDRIEIMLDWNNPRNKKYFRKYLISLSDPQFTLRKDNPDEKDILRANYLYADHYWSGLITTSPLFKDSLNYELKIYKNNQLVKAYFPYNQVNEPRFLFTQDYVSLNNTDVPAMQLVARPFCDTVYRLYNDSLTPVYQLVLPLENSLPATFYTKPFKNKTERENFDRNNGWLFHNLADVYETPKYLFFGIRYLTNFESYIYQKQTGTSYKTKNIRPDSTQYNLNLLAERGLQRTGDRFYKSIKAGDIITFFDSHKNAVVPKELETFLKNKPNVNTPVIVEFTFKN